MKFCNILSVFSILTINLTVALMTDIKTVNLTKGAGLISRTEANNHKKEENNPSFVTSPLNFPGLDLKQVNSANAVPKIKSIQLPLSIPMITNPQTLPVTIPLRTQYPNGKPAHHGRLKPNLEINKNTGPNVNINQNLNKRPLKNKVYPIDRLIPKTAHKKPGRKNTMKTNQKHEPNTSTNTNGNNLVDDDTNIESLPTDKHSKIKKINDENEKKHQTESVNDSNDGVVNFKNATHSIQITKLSESDDKHDDEKKKPDDKTIDLGDTHIGKILQESLVIPPNAELEANNADVSPGILYKKLIKEHPICSQNAVELPDTITITNHNYAELEERDPLYERTVPRDCTYQNIPEYPWNPNPYSNILQNYHTVCNQYLRNIAENHAALYKKGNCYPLANTVEINPDNPIKVSETHLPNENQVQEIIYGQKPETFNIDIHPENALGRIWRTWKDTEIKISKPKTLKSRNVNDIRRNFNNIGKNFNDLERIEENCKPSPCDTQASAIGLNGYYSNLNNPLAYPCLYPTYRYML